MTAQPKTMTTVYVTNTGHVLAVLTRTNPGGTPAAAELAAGGLLVRGLYQPTATATAPATFPDMFLVPAADLKTQDVPIDTTSAPALLNPRAFGLAVGSGAGGAPPPPQPAFEPLQPFGTAPTITLKLTGALTITLDGQSAGKPYYVVVVSYIDNAQATPTVLNAFAGTVPSGSSPTVAVQTNPLVNQPYSVLLLVAGLRPVVRSNMAPT